MAKQEESVISVAIEKDALVVGGHALITGNPTYLSNTTEAGGLIIGAKSPGPRSSHDVVLGQVGGTGSITYLGETRAIYMSNRP